MDEKVQGTFPPANGAARRRCPDQARPPVVVGNKRHVPTTIDTRSTVSLTQNDDLHDLLTTTQRILVEAVYWRLVYDYGKRAANILRRIYHPAIVHLAPTMDCEVIIAMIQTELRATSATPMAMLQFLEGVDVIRYDRYFLRQGSEGYYFDSLDEVINCVQCPSDRSTPATAVR